MAAGRTAAAEAPAKRGIPTDPAARKAYFSDLAKRRHAAASAAVLPQRRAHSRGAQERALARAETAERTGKYLVADMPEEERAKWDAVAPAVTGRPSKLDAERTQKVLTALGIGAPLTAAAGAAGIGAGTLEGWIAQGEVDIAGDRDSAHARFAHAVRRVELAAIPALLERMQHASANDWQRWAWMLERRWPEWFARRDALHVQQSGDVHIVVEHVQDWRARDVIEVEPAKLPEPRKGKRERELDGQPA